MLNNNNNNFNGNHGNNRNAARRRAPMVPGRNPVDRVKTKRIHPVTSKGCQAHLKEMFSHINLEFVGNKPIFEHVCAGFARSEGNNIGIQRLSGCYSRDNPILDVGFSLRNSYKNCTIHGCECGTDTYTLLKLARTDRAKPNSLLVDGARRTNQRWTYCRCNDVHCGFIVFIITHLRWLLKY